MMRFLLLLAAALLLEADVFGAAAGLGGLALAEPARLGLHLAASVLVAWAFRRLPGTRSPAMAGNLALLAGVANLFMPVMAPAGLWLALGGGPQRRAADPRRTDAGEDADAPAPAAASAATPPAGMARDLWGVLRHAPDPRQRVEALEATLDLDDASAVPMLRFALRDAEDEVRLLAFALVTERELACTGPAATSPQPQAFVAERQGAYAQWRLAQLAGVGGPAAQPLCRRALRHARAALAHRQQDGGLHLLAARLHLELGELTQAATAIDTAQQHGFAHERCARLRLELAFRSRARRAGSAP